MARRVTRSVPRPPLAGLRFRRVAFGLFDYSVHVVIGDRVAAVRYVRWFFDDPQVPDMDARGMCFCREGYCPVVWIPRRPRTAREYGTAAHEALHAVSQLMAWAHIEHRDATEEVFTHALGWLVTNIVELGMTASPRPT